MVEVDEGGVLVVGFEQDGAAAQGAGGLAVHVAAEMLFDADGGFVGFGIVVGVAAAQQAGGAAAADVLFHADLLAQVGQVPGEDDQGQAAAPPQSLIGDDGESAEEQGGQDEAEYRALAEGVAGGAGDGIGFGVVAAAAAARRHEFRVVGVVFGIVGPIRRPGGRDARRGRFEVLVGHVVIIGRFVVVRSASGRGLRDVVRIGILGMRFDVSVIGDFGEFRVGDVVVGVTAVVGIPVGRIVVGRIVVDEFGVRDLGVGDIGGEWRVDSGRDDVRRVGARLEVRARTPTPGRPR